MKEEEKGGKRERERGKNSFPCKSLKIHEGLKHARNSLCIHLGDYA